MTATTGHDRLVTPADLAEALALLTRLSVPSHGPRGAAAAWAWPLAGLVVALACGVVASVLIWLGVPAVLAAGLVLGVQIAVTGGLHEDGIADTADGFWGGATPDRRLEIMKDSRIGSYGVTALILSIGLRWVALSQLFAADLVFAPLIASAVLSRGAMAVLMAALPNARAGGLSTHVGRPRRETVLLATILAVGFALPVSGWSALTAVVWITFAVVGLAAVARAKIGGQTGDVLGATQQVAELTTLIVLASLA